MNQIPKLYLRHARLIRFAWLAVLLALAACNNGDGGGGGADDGGLY